MSTIALTVAVSIAAGVAAITSAFPEWHVRPVEWTLGFVVILMLGKLRGIKESGRIFALPTYFFVVTILMLIGVDGWTPREPRRNVVLVPISGMHRAVVQALDYAKTLSPDVRAVYVGLDAEATGQLKAQLPQWGQGVRLVILDSPYRSLMEPLLEYMFHNQSALLIKGALLFKPNTVVTSVPFHLRR